MIEALQHAGLPVWWDGRVAVGTEWDLQIDDELRRAACVVVLWTPESVRSRWVRSEARESFQAGTLLSVLVGTESRRPVEFSSVQGIELAAAGGTLDATDRDALVAGVRAVIERVPVAVRPLASRSRRRPRVLVAAVAAVAAACAGATAVLTWSPAGPRVRAVALGEHPWDVAVTPAMVWVTDQSASLVWRRDRTTGTASSLSVPGAFELARSDSGRTVAVSSATERSTAYVVVGDAPPLAIDTGAAIADMAMDDRTLWVAQHDVGRVTAIDLSTGARRWSVAVPGVLSLAADDGGVWATSAVQGAGGLTRLEPDSGRALGRAATGELPVGITTFDREVWVGDERRGTVDVFDRTLHRIATVAAGSGVVDLASDARSVWVSSSASAELVAIDGRTRRVRDRHRTQGQPFKIDSDRTLVAASSPSTGEVVLAGR